MLAAIAAAPGEAVNANTGTLLGLKGLIAALAVRFGPPLWAFAAGLVLGVVEAAIANVHLGSWQLGPSYREVLPLALRARADRGLALARGARGTRVSAVAAGRTRTELATRARGGPGRLALARVARGRSDRGRGARPVPVAAGRAGGRAGADDLPRASRRPRSACSSAPRACRRSGTGAFMAIGAFTSALLVAREDWPLEPAALAGALAALAAGLLFGRGRSAAPRVRRREHLGARVARLARVLLAFPSISGGSQGLIVPERRLLGLDATPTVHFEVALALLVADGARDRGRAPRGARVWSSRRCARRRRSRPRSASGSGGGGSARSPRPRSWPGSPGGLSVQLAAVADPASYDPFLSFKLLVAVLLGGAAATLGPAAGRRRPRADRARVGAARAAAAAAARALRRGRRRAAARVRARARRRRDRPLGDALARPPRLAPAAPSRPRQVTDCYKAEAARAAGERAGPARGRAAEGVRRGRRGRRALARAASGRDGRARRPERLREDDRAAADLRRGRSRRGPGRCSAAAT